MKQTAEICSSLVSQRIIDHLWETVDEYNDDSFIFILSVQHLGYEKVQDIIILRNNTSSHQTIIGCKPVELTIEVNKIGSDYVMSLIPSSKTANELSRQKNNRALSYLRRLIKPTITFPYGVAAKPALRI